MQISMSRTGYDNAHMESFFKTVKYEEVHLSNYKPTTMSSSAFLISSSRCITANDCILPWGIYPPIEYEMAIQLTETADRASLNSR